MSSIPPDFRTRGRVIARDPGSDPDVLASCPECGALVVTGDEVIHSAWHALLTHTVRKLTTKGN